jgi:hypothetical protein
LTCTVAVALMGASLPDPFLPRGGRIEFDRAV